MANTRNYTNIASIKEDWINQIAPNYFDMENVNNYQLGIFGYINEVMANATEDAHHAINIARREFYPVAAEFKQSLYKMATLQNIDLPMVTPATTNAILIIPENEIMDRSTYSNGIYTCVIDDSMKIMADNIPFMLDYPIIIISKKSGNRWIHTSHYDITVSNSLNSTNNRYIVNKTIVANGVSYLLLAVSLRQVEVESISEIITKDATIDTATIDFTFNGDLASFEVFYKENDTSEEVQLKKVLRGGLIPQVPFCYYELLDDNLIRLTFPKNAYFTPLFNSEIRMEVYTSMGENGNFDIFKGSLVCTMNSERYPNNNTMTVTGQINGSCEGGLSKPTDEEFRREILAAYTTNNTITTSNDLQVYFNSIAEDLAYKNRNKIYFIKKRDDALIRLFGAYSLIKDTYDNVVPTNTVNVEIKKSDFADVEDATVNRITIKPGSIFEYKADEGDSISHDCVLSTAHSLMDDLDVYDDNNKFLFTNPFLISITLNPNIIGYYLNSFNVSKPIEYEYVNDNTLSQFIASTLKIDRNAMGGEDFYKFTIFVSPASDMDITKIVTVPDTISPETREDNFIRAKQDGKILSLKYKDTHVEATIKYIDDTEETIIASSFTTKSETGKFVNTTGYTLQFNVGESFIENDVIAIKKVTDLGKLRACLDFKGLLFENNMYIPMMIEGYEKATNMFELCAYISTNDEINQNAQLIIQHGIFMNNALENDNVAVPMNRLSVAINVFYFNDDINFSHKYNEFEYFKNYTLTNTYVHDAEEDSDKIALIQQIDFIRSQISFRDHETNLKDFYIDIDEMPVAKANWCKSYSNFKYLVETMYNNYLKLYEVYFLLENDFGIDFKFFNTYGKAKFFKVGINNDKEILDSVNCSFSFGVYLKSVGSSYVFLEKFKTFVKEYVESINSITSEGQSIYILNMIAEIKSEFPEIGYIEYYGFNKYDHWAQKIEGYSELQISQLGIRDYIPEFINIQSIEDGDKMVPKIDVTLLKE